MRRSILKALKSYITQVEGNVAVIFSLSVVVLVCAIGGGIDFVTAQKARAKMQDAADAGLLAATVISGAATEPAMKAKADQIFNSQIAHYSLDEITTDFDKVEKTLTYTASAKVPTTFLGLIGLSEIPVDVISKSSAGLQGAELVFVLDTTGSMANDDRMVNLKSSVNSVLSQLKASGSTSTKVAIVPFATQVRLTPGTGLPYINYGQGYKGYDCGNMDWWTCQMTHHITRKVCGSAGNDVSIKECFTNGLHKNVKITDNGTERIIEGYATAYNIAGSNYKTYTHHERWKLTNRWVDGGSYWVGDSCNAETGVCTPGHYQPYGGYWAQNLVVEVREFEEQTEHDLNLYNNRPSGFSNYDNANNYNDSDWYGYGVAPERIDKGEEDGIKTAMYYPPTINMEANWQGCINDRAGDYDVKGDVANSAVPNSLYPATRCWYNLATMLPLTTDFDSAIAKLNSLTPDGETNITIGVQWGMEAFTSEMPLGGGSGFAETKIKKYMILVTDGINTRNTRGDSTATIDARTKMACDNAKALGITIYVVRVMEGDTALLKGCASGGDKFYDVTAASQLNGAMNDILDSINRVRLTQ